MLLKFKTERGWKNLNLFPHPQQNFCIDYINGLIELVNPKLIATFILHISSKK